MSRTHRLLLKLTALLQPMTGARAAGTVTAQATTAPTEVPKNTYLVPVVDGELDFERAAKTTETVNVLTTPTAVPIVTNVGGTIQNFTPTLWRWLPPVTGLNPTAVSAVAPVGGTEGDIKQVQVFERIVGRDVGKQLMQGNASRYPAIMVSWSKTAKTSKIGAGRTLNHERFQVALIVTRMEQFGVRLREGLDLLDDIEELLVDATANTDGERVSAPAGVTIVERVRIITPTDAVLHLYALEFEAQAAYQRRVVRDYVDWEQTSYTLKTEPREAPDADTGKPVVDDAIYDQDPETTP